MPAGRTPLSVTSMTENDSRTSVLRWWVLLAFGTLAALLIAWLARVAGVNLHTLLSIVAGAAGLAWLIVLVAVPWNLYFAARMVSVQMAGSQRRGITVAEPDRAEAARISRRMLWFALGGHLVTAAATAVLTIVTGDLLGFYLTGFYLLSALIRPAVAYFAHLRERIGSLAAESTHPRDDVLTLRSEVKKLSDQVKLLTIELPRVAQDHSADLHRTEARLNDDLGHARQQLTTDLSRLEDAQAADREAARSRHGELARRIDVMVRQIESTLDGISDHQELQVGIRALIRMIKADQLS